MYASLFQKAPGGDEMESATAGVLGADTARRRGKLADLRAVVSQAHDLHAARAPGAIA
jgi:hypothetical protein